MAARKPRKEATALDHKPEPTGQPDPPAPTRWTPPPSWTASGPANSRRPETVDPPSPPPPTPSVSTARRPGTRIAVTLVAGLSALVGGVVAGGLVLFFSDDAVQDTSTEIPAGQQSLSVEQTSAIADAAARARPSVVRIESTRLVAGGSEQDVGSGVVLDAEGHVITNAHVVLGTDTLKVILQDGTERPAVVIGHDYPFTDVAVLQIGPGKLTPIEPGNSQALRLGESVLAIGNPLAEFDGSVSIGVISGLDRVRVFDGVRQSDLIQTDAAVNPGNSGGALVNIQGQFVGMPTAVVRQTRAGSTAEGLAFALPASRVLLIAQGIIRAGGTYPRPSLDAEHVDLTPEVLARLSRSTVREGALIAAVTPGGAAATAGIIPGDIVTRIGDSAITTASPLLNAIMPYQPGDSAKVVLNRNGRIIETEVRFAQRS